MAPPHLDSSAPHGARVVALRALDQASAAAARLDDPSDAEALHDFRVALRRLRATLRAYDETLGDAVPRRLRQRLARLARRTNPGRDAEVQSELVETLTTELEPADEPGLAWLRAAIGAAREEAFAVGRAKAARRFGKLERALRARLSVYEVTVRLDDRPARPRFAEVLASVLEGEAEILGAALRALEERDDPALTHRARLVGKRVRYLLEPLREQLDEAEGLVRELRRLQDALGEINDLHALAERVGEAIEDVAVDGARRLRVAALGGPPVDVEHALQTDERRGLLALLRRAQVRRVERLDGVRREWLAEGALDRLLEAVPALVARLRQQPSVEIERKYLVRELPAVCAGQAAVEIDQGYLPGERLIERIRRKRTSKGETYVRTVKLGEGMVRIEVEEPCTREVFEQLWPLTEGRRVQKRRYAIEDGPLVWEIDEFLDRELVLAEVELPSEDTEVSLPAWLAEHVEREVTLEPAYVNANLAR